MKNFFDQVHALSLLRDLLLSPYVHLHLKMIGLFYLLFSMNDLGVTRSKVKLSGRQKTKLAKNSSQFFILFYIILFICLFIILI